MKKIIYSFLLIIFSSFFLSACGQEKSNINLIQNTSPTMSVIKNSSTITPSSANQNSNFVAIKTKYGEIVLKLYTDQAPNTVANFVSKAESGFYKNLTFHRVVPDFVVQGGDPLGNGTGGGNIKSEINSVPFVRGSLGLARGGDRNISNDSQFFICLTTEGCQHLSNDYVNFGEVVSGIEFVDQIQQGDKILDIVTTTK